MKCDYENSEGFLGAKASKGSMTYTASKYASLQRKIEYLALGLQALRHFSVHSYEQIAFWTILCMAMCSAP